MPDHAPLAVQEVASVEDHVTVLEPPLATVSGLADSDMVGNGVIGAGVLFGKPVVASLPAGFPPQAASQNDAIKGRMKTVREVCMHGVLIECVVFMSFSN